jgi:hypothetical protein
VPVVGAVPVTVAVCPTSTVCDEGVGAATTRAELTEIVTADDERTTGVEAESVTRSSKLYVPTAVDPVVVKLHVRVVGAAQLTAFEYEEAPGASSIHWYE